MKDLISKAGVIGREKYLYEGVEMHKHYDAYAYLGEPISSGKLRTSSISFATRRG
jgi:hypothetical protein